MSWPLARAFLDTAALPFLPPAPFYLTPDFIQIVICALDVGLAVESTSAQQKACFFSCFCLGRYPASRPPRPVVDRVMLDPDDPWRRRFLRPSV